MNLILRLTRFERATPTSAGVKTAQMAAQSIAFRSIF